MIGIFDSGYGGLTILQGIHQQLPDRDLLYLGDNARAPYGNRSFDVVYQFTRQAVLRLFALGCHLVILGCNTASAKALRSIQQRDLPRYNAAHGTDHRVLGVIRPTAEVIGSLTNTRHVGLVATEGTVRSRSYDLEIAKLHPDITITSQACPLWAAIVEAGEADSDGARYFVKKRIGQLLEADPRIDAIILGCTHYPLLLPAIEQAVPPHVRIVPQGRYVAEALQEYLHRHPEHALHCTTGGRVQYLTTESPERFRECADIFLHQHVDVAHIEL